jgi:type II secretory pathway component PulK
MKKEPVKVLKRRRGVILILCTWIMVVLVTLSLVLAQRVRVESMAAGNRVSQLQAEQIERGAEQWVLCQVDQTAGDAVTVTQTPAEAVQLGDGYFWILRNCGDDTVGYDGTQYSFGITDESGKLNLNYATTDMMMYLPGMTQEAADSIKDWVDTDSTVTGSDGAEDTEYMTLPLAYHCKNGPLDSVEELNLVMNVTPDLFYGFDLNRNGVIEEGEQLASNGGSMFSTADSDPRGFFPFVTAWTKPAAAAAGGGGGGGGGGAATPFAKININTAPLQVLRCLPGLEDADAQAIVDGRAGGIDTTTTTWLSTVITQAKATALANYIAATSNYYSADIVAATANGRAFKRVRIVVDASSSPPKILYRKDISDLGWPLDPQIQQDLRAGKEPSTSGIQTLNGGF